MNKIDLKSLTPDELTEFILSIGEPKFKAKQIYKWLYRNVSSFEEMSDISKSLRARLDAVSYINRLTIEKKLVSQLDGTVKYLFRLIDGEYIESVFMKYKHGNTVCISSQVGCAMGCKFCASTLCGKVRNLAPSEIIDQVMSVENDTGEKISNIVMMGIGEPLDNFDNVVKFLKNVNDENGLNIGYRHISISTCGLCDKIYALADLGFPITLSVSLHNPFLLERKEIMPIANKYTIDDLYKAMNYWLEKNGRRISIEYALIDGINNTKRHADELVRLFKHMLIHINLIPVNNVAERDFKKPRADTVNEFMNYLLKHGLNATVRRELGPDINAACGQLRGERNEDRNIH